MQDSDAHPSAENGRELLCANVIFVAFAFAAVVAVAVGQKTWSRTVVETPPRTRRSPSRAIPTPPQHAIFLANLIAFFRIFCFFLFFAAEEKKKEEKEEKEEKRGV